MFPPVGALNRLTNRRSMLRLNCCVATILSWPFSDSCTTAR